MKYCLLLFASLLSQVLVKAQRAGDLDSNFGINGYIILAETSKASAIARQTNGSIILAGSVYHRPAVFGLTQNGYPDSSFAVNGIDTSLSSSCTSFTSLYVQNDQKIIAAGSGMLSSYDQYYATRLSANGFADSSFNDSSYVMNSFYGSDNVCLSVAVQMDGKIIMCGVADYYGGLMRYNANGSVDSPFAVNGKRTVGPGTLQSPFVSVNKVLLQSDNKIIVTGGEMQFVLFRFMSDGNTDTSFGINGVMENNALGNCLSLSSTCAAVLPNDKILLGGTAKVAGTGNDFILARYSAEGIPDSSFGTNGVVITDMGAGVDDNAYAMALQADGKIILAGNSGDSSKHQFALIRYLPDGAVDTGFGVAGRVLTSILGIDDKISAVTIANDGGIIVCGQAIDNSGKAHLAAAKYFKDNLVNVERIQKNVPRVNIYPNPNSGIFTIQSESPGTFILLNSLGEIVYNKEILTGKTDINISLTNGIYIAKIINAQGTKQTEIVVQR